MLLVRVVFIFLKLVLLEAVCLGRTVRAIATFISLLSAKCELQLLLSL